MDIRKNEIIAKLFKDKWDTFNLLCDEYFEKGDDVKARKSILKQIEHVIDEQKKPRNLRFIEEELNMTFNNIMQKLRKDFPGFKESDLKILMLSFAGLSPRAACILTGLTYKTLQNRKSLLKKAIINSESPNKDLFLKNF